MHLQYRGYDPNKDRVVNTRNVRLLDLLGL